MVTHLSLTASSGRSSSAARALTNESARMISCVSFSACSQRVALLLSYPHRRCMLLTEKTFCATASVAYDVVVQPHCKPLSEVSRGSPSSGGP